MSDTTVRQYTDILSADDIAYILSLPEVAVAKQRIETRSGGSEYFSIALTPEIKSAIHERMGLDLAAVDSVPMRWIKGDSHPHIDTAAGARAFDDTYLMYLTDSAGSFIADGTSYPITQGTAYVFSEGISHETANTGAEPRLLLGPMSAEGFAVGMAGISGSGGSTIFIRQNGVDVEYSPDTETWNTLYWPCMVTNTDTEAGVLKIEFMTDISFNTNFGYFVVSSEHIQFGSTSLREDGTRPIIHINGDGADYPGFIQNGSEGGNGYNDIYVYNLRIIASNTISLATGAGWIGQQYYAKSTYSNYIINCAVDGPIGDSCGGIVGANAGYNEGLTLSIIGCSTTGGPAGSGAGGIVGANPQSIRCESCWTTGAISGVDAGGITGSGIQYVQIVNCYSEGVISGANAGGIVGGNSGDVFISKCYSRGAASGATSGGICGGTEANGNREIENCYTVGAINGTGNAGGIFGQVTSGNVNINNCYVAGSTSGSQGYIVGASADNYSGSSCYSEAANGASGWNSVNAAATLQGVPSPVIGDSWVATVIGQPYEIRNMGYSPYGREVIVGNSLSKINIKVGGEVEKDMADDNYYAEFDPSEHQAEFFPGMADFIANNILAGDKAQEDRLRASYWDDLGDDVFDDWGYFYIYDVGTGKYYFPLLSPQNQDDGVLTTQTFSVFGRTFTITHGWAAQGIFKMDITATGTAPYRFGAYGAMGSDGNEETDNLTQQYTIGGVNKTLYYRRDAEQGDTEEILYTYIIPASGSTSQPYNVYYDGGDMSMVTEPLTGGITIYFAKTNDVKDWVINELKVAAGEQSEYAIPPGQTTVPALIPGKNYTVLQIDGGDPDSYGTITLDPVTGIFTTTAETVPGVYTVYIRNTGSYNISSYILTVAESGELSCCERPLYVTGFDDRTRMEIMTAVVLENGYRRGPMTYDDMMKLKMMHAARR
jgi:hypothetical protein